MEVLRMTRRVIHPIALVAVLAALALPAPAVASPAAVVQDCADDGALSGNHSNADKRGALGQIPADLDEYSDCRAVISGSITSNSNKTAAPKASTSANSTATSSEEDSQAETTDEAATESPERAERKAQKKRDRAEAARQVALAERTVGPRTAGVLEASDTANGMPLPVLLALIALALLGAAGGLLVLGKRRPGFAGALRRGRFPRSRR
jgi:hypothetical protein